MTRVSAGKDARFELRLPADELEGWAERAAAEGVTVANLVRDAMKKLLAGDVRRATEERRMAALGRRVVALVRDLPE